MWRSQPVGFVPTELQSALYHKVGDAQNTPNEKSTKQGRANNNVQENVICAIPPNSQRPRPCQTVGRSTRRDTKHNHQTSHFEQSCGPTDFYKAETISSLRTMELTRRHHKTKCEGYNTTYVLATYRSPPSNTQQQHTHKNGCRQGASKE